MVSFHLPPTARKAACSGQSASACGGGARYAPAGAFLSLDMMAPSVVALDCPGGCHDRPTPWMVAAAGTARAGGRARPARLRPGRAAAARRRARFRFRDRHLEDPAQAPAAPAVQIGRAHV